nr:MAG TPA: adenine-specific methyltransferase [Caudoviricetes sp.]
MDFDGTRNLFIEAENLEALKILQKAYAGSVKMIYIDPPYNTGSDSFIYPDKFSETREEYARRVGDKDDNCYLKRDGIFQGAWRKNSKDDGHYHSKWLSMMLPRLHLARTLLRDNGVIFISIDDNEQAQLKLLCDEVFGAENFVACLPWRGRGGGADDKRLLQNHEYVFMYAKNSESFTTGRKIKTDEVFPKFDEDKQRFYKTQLARKWGNGARKEDRPNLYYPIIMPNGVEIYPILPDGTDGRWRWKQERFQAALKNGDIEFSCRNDGYWEAYEKIYQPQDGEIRTKLYAAWLQDEIREELEELLEENDPKNTAYGTKQVKQLFDGGQYFDYPKPTVLVELLTKIGSFNSNDLILDFFSGSGTTAHTVMQLNAEDGGNRRYLCVQLPEDLNISLAQATSSEAKRTIQNAIDFLDSINKEQTIAEIAKERIRRAGAAVSGSLNTHAPDLTRELVGSLKNGVTPEAVLQQLANAYPKLDHTAMQNELARLIFLADVVGRLEAQAELGEA